MKRPLSHIISLVFLLAPGCLWAQELNEAEEAAIQAAVDKMAASVVQIETIGGLISGGGPLEGGSRTSGTIVSEDGFILSSLFGFAQNPSGILVTLPNGKRVAGKLIAKDTQRNLALLKVETETELAVPESVTRGQLRPGQWSIALGKIYSAEMPTVSVGIVSATHRVWGKAVQTDAKISPNNYGGPLVDIRGRVIGILTPLSPQETGSAAGLEWYDSGIGFAVPLADLLPRLDTMKDGNDLQPGLLGINLEGKDDVADQPTVAAVRYNSPAQQAGIQEKDVIVEVNDKPIERQAQLKHVLGEAYAGDLLTMKLQRGDEEVSVELTLAAELIPYARPLLGIALKRTANKDEDTIIAYVFEETAAAKIGLKTGDTIIRYDDTETATSSALRQAVATAEPGTTHKIVVLRDDEEVELEIEPGIVPDKFLTGNPAPSPAEGVEAQAGVVTGESDFQLAEEQNAAKLFVPDVAAKLPSLGLVVLLSETEFTHEPQREAWRQQAAKYGFAVLEIAPADGTRWTRPETSVVRKLIDKVRGSYTIDAQRTVVVGGKSAGAMALLHGFENREIQAGAVAVEAVIPRGVNIPDNEPLERLELVFLTLPDSPVHEAAEKQIERLREMKFPVISQVLTESGEAKALAEAQVEQLAEWLNTLDRI